MRGVRARGKSLDSGPSALQPPPQEWESEVSVTQMTPLCPLFSCIPTTTFSQGEWLARSLMADPAAPSLVEAAAKMVDAEGKEVTHFSYRHRRAGGGRLSSVD